MTDERRAFEISVEWLRSAERFAARIENLDAPVLEATIARAELVDAKAQLRRLLTDWEPREVM